jgi:hypothetical protein
MNEEQLEQVIAEQMEIIPEDIRAMIAAGKVEEVSAQLMQDFSLTQEQTNAVSKELLILLIGLSPIEEFEASLVQALGGDEALAKTVYEACDHLLLSEITDSLNELSEDYKVIESEDTEVESEAVEGTEVKSAEEAVDIDLDNPSTPSPSAAEGSLASRIPITRANTSGQAQGAIYNTVRAPLDTSSEDKKFVDKNLLSPNTTINPSDIPRASEMSTEITEPAETRMTEVKIQKPKEPSFSFEEPKSKTGTIIDEKLTKITQTPSEKVTVNVATAKNNYGGTDPYREPLN